MSAPPPAAIDLHTSYFPVSFLLAWTGPEVVLDGRVVHRTWGRATIPVHPGRHHIAVYTRYLGQFGRADTTVDVPPRTVVPVYYRAPALFGMGGAIGTAPQESPGATVAYLILLLPVVVIAALVVLAILSV